MDDDTREMARRCYGYGRWEAPYWFIGPEQGMAREENNDLRRRVEAWVHFGRGELDDCRDFHDRICEKRWHCERPQPQPTWRRLMLLLMTFLERSSDNDSMRYYQRDRWGRLSGGETCVIELSGLAANNLTVSRERDLFRKERIATILQRMRTYKPSFVIMYGKSEEKHWQEIANGGPRSTILAFTPHPVWLGLRNADWIKFGERLRKLCGGQLHKLQEC